MKQQSGTSYLPDLHSLQASQSQRIEPHGDHVGFAQARALHVRMDITPTE